MGRLIRFELKKMLSGKFFWIVLCLLLAVNILLSCGAWELYNLFMDADENVLSTAEEGLSFFDYFTSSRHATESMRRRYGVLAEISQEERDAFEAAMGEKYGQDIWEYLVPTEEMLTVPGYFGGNLSDLDYISAYTDMKKWNAEIEETYQNVLRSAKAYGREALEEGDNYAVRRNLNIIRLYSTPRREITSPIQGWDDDLFESRTMLLVFLLVLLACAGSFSGERDRQTWLLLQTARNGRGKTLLAKYLAGAAAAAGFTILFQVTTVLSICFKIGFLGASQPVFALSELKLFPYRLTVWQYALVQLACRLFAAVLLSVLLNTVSALSRSNVISYAAGAVLLGGCLLPVYFPPKVEWLSGPLALSNPTRFFSSYYTADLFGFPVLWVVVQAVLWCLLGGGCVLLAQRVYHRKREAV